MTILTIFIIFLLICMCLELKTLIYKCNDILIYLKSIDDNLHGREKKRKTSVDMEMTRPGR